MSAASPALLPSIDRPSVASAARSCACCLAAPACRRLLIGRDTRESGDWIEAELAHGAASAGAEVATAGVVPDARRRLPDADGGLRPRGRHLRVAQSVRGQRHQGLLGRAARSSPRASSARSRPSSPTRRGPRAAARRGPVARVDLVGTYLDHLARRHERPCRRRVSLVIDCANGATSPVAPGLFRSLGFDTDRHRRSAGWPQHQPGLRIDPPGAAVPHGRRAGPPAGHRVRRRRRPRDLRGSPRRDRQRRRGPAALRAPAPERASPRRPDRGGDRDEQHRARAGAARSGHRARAHGRRRQVRDGGDAGARRLARRRAVGPRHLLGLSLYGRRALHGAERAADDGRDAVDRSRILPPTWSTIRRCC